MNTIDHDLILLSMLLISIVGTNAFIQHLTNIVDNIEWVPWQTNIGGCDVLVVGLDNIVPRDHEQYCSQD